MGQENNIEMVPYPYIVGYNRDDVSKGDWPKNRMEKWEGDINSLIKMVDKYPQSSYAAVACAVQSEWIFLQCVTNDTGQAFTGLENFLR